MDAHLRAWETRGRTSAAERQFARRRDRARACSTTCARTAPVVLAIEDVHWADPAHARGSRARRERASSKLPAALIVSARPRPRRPELERLLGVLEARDATTSRARAAGRAARPPRWSRTSWARRPGERLVAQARRAAGNPLFVGELVARCWRTAPSWRTGRPTWRRRGRAVAPRDDPAPAQLPGARAARAARPRVRARGRLRRRRPRGAVGAACVGARSGAADRRTCGRARRAGRPARVPPRAGPRRALRGHAADRAARPAQAVRGALVEAGEPPERVAEHLLRGRRPATSAPWRRSRGRRATSSGRPRRRRDLYRHAMALSADPAGRGGSSFSPELAEALVSAGLLGEGEQACREALRARSRPRPGRASAPPAS